MMKIPARSGCEMRRKIPRKCCREASNNGVLRSQTHCFIGIGSHLESRADSDCRGIGRVTCHFSHPSTNLVGSFLQHSWLQSIEELPSKIKGLMTDSKKSEAAIAAIKISYLKMINRHSNIVIMDSYCDMAKTVARELTDLGFKNCWVMAGGFSGDQGWTQSYLGKKTYDVSSVETLPPSRDIFPTTMKLQSENETPS